MHNPIANRPVQNLTFGEVIKQLGVNSPTSGNSNTKARVIVSQNRETDCAWKQRRS